MCVKGAIPTEVGQLSVLTRLDLCNNELSGSFCLWSDVLWPPIGAEIDQSPTPPFCRNSGNIPTDVGLLRGLTRLILSSNGLTGALPRLGVTCGARMPVCAERTPTPGMLYVRSHPS